MTKDRIYKCWQDIKKRCDNPKNKSYKNYWWRWITYDIRWEKFELFYEDMKEWYKEHLTIDRKGNDWNYNKDNCRWATKKEQANNKRTCRYITYNWETLNLTQWCKKLNLNENLISDRVNKLWWDEFKALWLVK